MTEITPEAQTGRLWDYLKGYHAVHLINVGIKLDLFAELEAAADGLAPDDLAQALGLHSPYVAVWCATGVAYGLLEPAADGRYRLAPHYDQILALPGHPRGLAPYFTNTIDHVGRDMERYPEFFQTGGTYTFQEHGPEFTKAVGDTTAGFHVFVARRLLGSVPGIAAALESGGRILDMGCGAGGLLLKIAEAHPNAACLGVDVDAHGIAQAEAAIAEAGLGDRVAAELTDGGDIAHDQEFDVVTMFEVLHELPLGVRPQVLANAYKALKPGGHLFIIDETYPSVAEDLTKREYSFAVMTAFNELIWGNVVPTREDQEKLLGDAGFVDLQRGPVAEFFTLLTAQRPAA